MDRKGQASVEYLVILAVVLIIALVVVAALGGFINIGGRAGSQASQTYWRTAEIGLADWVMSSAGNDTLVIKNNMDYRIRVVNVTLIGVGGAEAVVNVDLSPGATATVSRAWSTCTSGNPFSYDVTFEYTNLDYNITGKSFIGVSPIEGNCA
ncbi:MAG: class III signal peptide-containing protein [Candidatus Altiarchaeota archaeon]|nr:class III signal peptide-containing protein [Candidatus Altiarchaeota archaeon]